MARLLGSAMMANDDSTTDISLSVYILVKLYSENQVSPRLQGCQSQASESSGPSKVAPRNPCHAFRSQSTSSKNNVPATGFALYGAMGLKPSDL